MSSFVRAGTFRIATGLAVILFGIAGAGLLAGSAGPAAAQSTANNHYLCYTATATGFKIPSGVQLVPETSTTAITPIFGPAAYHCNPTLKIVPGAKYPIIDPTWHYLCFTIKATQPSVTTAMNNQFGTAQLVTKNPNAFCVPSWKSLTGPPNKKPTTPKGANHYTCYPVSYATSSNHYVPPSPIMVQDEFAKAPVTVKVGAPQELCVPTEKILPSGLVYKINNPNLYYVCFAVSKTPIKSPVYDENQFGTGPVTIKTTRWLCLPSTP